MENTKKDSKQSDNQKVEEISTYRPKTKDKHFYDDEIKGIFPDGTLYLKEGVRRLKHRIDEELHEEGELNLRLKLNSFKEKYQNIKNEENNFD